MKKFFFLISVTAGTITAHAQDALDSVIANDRSHYIRITTENDFWKLRGITDRYFTNGVKVEAFFLPKGTENGLLDKLFPTLPAKGDRNNNFGIAFTMNMYTPINLDSVQPMRNDRPYAGWAYVSVKCVSNRFSTTERLTTEYSLGMIGPATRQKQLQTWLHNWQGYKEPQGWDNQIPNDLAVNLKTDYERRIFHPTQNIEVNGMVEGNFGTVSNFFGLGTFLRFGLFNDYFLNESGLALRKDTRKASRYLKIARAKSVRMVYDSNLNRQFQLFVFARTAFRTVLDNSLLQGGVFTSKKTVHRITADQLKRFYAQNDVGISVFYRFIGLAFTQSFRTPEFLNARTTHWGAVSVTIRFR